MPKQESDVRADFEALSRDAARIVPSDIPLEKAGVLDARADFEITSKAVVGPPVEQEIPIPEPKQG